MYKWMYDRLVEEEYKKMDVTQLANELMSLEEIECADRAFANHCIASNECYNINELFVALNELEIKPSTENMEIVLSKLSNARNSWRYISRNLEVMKDCGRVGNNLDDFKKRVGRAKEPNDII